MRHILILFLLLMLALPGISQETDSVYLFSHFVKNGEDGLHLAYSTDGLKWKALNGKRSFLKPEVGNDKLMRDPCIIQTEDGMFHMVWTVSWGEKGIGYASSEDLIHWNEQKYLPVMEHEAEAMNCWAPEIFFDSCASHFLIFWSTSIPGRFPDTDGTGDRTYNHRMYYVTSRDMETFSETTLFYDPGFNSIDGTLSKQGDSCLLFLKDETRFPEEQKNIRMAKGGSPTGPWSPASEPIYDKVWVEGPTLLRVRDDWILYFDRYRKSRMGAISSRDLVHWEDISKRLRFPRGTRHGTILKVSRSVLTNILANKSPSPAKQ